MNAPAPTSPEPMSFMKMASTVMGAVKTAANPVQAQGAQQAQANTDAEMVRAAVLAGRKGKMSDIKDEMKTAAWATEQAMKEAGLAGKGSLTEQQMAEISAKVKSNSHYRAAVATSQKETLMGAKTLVAAGVTTAAAGGLGYVAGGIVGLPFKAVAALVGKSDAVSLGGFAKVGRNVAAAVVGAVTGTVAAVAGWRMLKNSRENAKRANALEEMIKVSAERVAAKPVAPTVSAHAQPEVAAPAARVEPTMPAPAVAVAEGAAVAAAGAAAVAAATKSAPAPAAEKPVQVAAAPAAEKPVVEATGRVQNKGVPLTESLGAVQKAIADANVKFGKGEVTGGTTVETVQAAKSADSIIQQAADKAAAPKTEVAAAPAKVDFSGPKGYGTVTMNAPTFSLDLPKVAGVTGGQSATLDAKLVSNVKPPEPAKDKAATIG